MYAYYGNAAVDVDSSPVSRARLTVVEPALFEKDVFEMVAPFQSTVKCEVFPSHDFSTQKLTAWIQECGEKTQASSPLTMESRNSSPSRTKRVRNFGSEHIRFVFDLPLTFSVTRVRTIFCTLIFLSRLHELWS